MRVYLVAVAAAAAAALLRLLIHPLVGQHLPFSTLFLFFLAVIVAARAGGGRPALLATGLSLFLAWELSVTIGPSFAAMAGPHLIGLALYLAACAGIAWLGEATQVSRRRVTATLRQLEERERAAADGREVLRVTLASIGDAVMTTDTAGLVTFMNDVAAVLTGWTAEEAAGQPLDAVLRLVHEESREPVANPALQALREGVIVGLANHTVLIARDGQERPIDDSAAPIRDARGHVTGSVLVFRDVTERRKADHARALLAGIVESSDDAIVSKNLDGVIQSWNAAAERLFGYAAEEAIGRHVTLVIPPERRDEERMILARLRRGERIDHFETLRTSKSGRALHVSLTVSPVRDAAGHIVGASKIARDITARKEAEEALHQQREWLRVTLASIGDAVIATGLDGAVTFLNPVAEGLTGWTLREAEGQPLERVFRIVGEGTRRPVDNPALRAMAEGAIVGLANHTVLIAKDGTERVIDDSGAPIKDSEGRTVGAVLVFRDVTERTRAEALLRLSSEAARHVLTADDPDEMVQGLFNKIKEPLALDAYVNHTVSDGGDRLRLASWAGVSEEDVRPIRELELGSWISGTAAARREPVHATHIQASDEPMTRLARPAGMRACCAYPLLADYRLLGTLSFASRTKDAFTEDELGFLGTVSHYVTVAYERLRLIRELRAGDRRKDEFLATLAHELRSPLAPLSNMLEVMKRAGEEGGVVRQARDTMERQLAQMVRLVDDLLDVSRISRNRLELRKGRVELASVVHQAVEAARPLADAARHELLVSLPAEPVYLHADPARLAQVFGNLLANACKYTLPGGRVRLTAGRQDGEAVVAVKDTGIGIPPDKLVDVFEMFSQVESTREQSQGGLGIGLTLAKRLVDMHGGVIEARSEGPGRGSEFVVRLPILAKTPEAAAAPSVAAGPAAVRRRILVVDDNPDSATSLAMLLEVMGNTTAVAQDGLEAVAAAERFRPDVVLLDIGLPKLNGYDACRRIRAQPWGADMTIVALTGWGQDEDRRLSKDAGFDRHMVKPVDHAELTRLLATPFPGSDV